MSEDEIKRLLDEGLELGRRTQAAIDAVCGAPATVPASEHQRLEAACARYREVLEEMLVSEIQDDPDDESVRIRWCFDCDTGAENGVITHAPDCLLSSDAGAPLLERVERAESMLDGAWREYDRVKTERDAASAESADLRARLETAERLAKASISILPDSCHTPAEVEHRNRVADTLEHLGWLPPDAAAALRSRLEQSEKEHAEAVRTAQLSIDCEREERQARKDAEAILFVHGLDCATLRDRKASSFEIGRKAYDERHASEVRRAVEEERAALVALIERDVSNAHVGQHLIAAIRARSRGGA